MSIEAANDMRQKILSGYVPTEEEMNNIIKALIGDRANALMASNAKAAAKGTGTKKSTTAKIDLDDLLGE